VWVYSAPNSVNPNGNIFLTCFSAGLQGNILEALRCAEKSGSAISTLTSKKQSGLSKKMSSYLPSSKITGADGRSSADNLRASGLNTQSRTATTCS